jgi:hypothetical protein
LNPNILAPDTTETYLFLSEYNYCATHR